MGHRGNLPSRVCRIASWRERPSRSAVYRSPGNSRASGADLAVGTALEALGTCAREQGDLKRAATLFAESLTLLQEGTDRFLLPTASRVWEPSPRSPGMLSEPLAFSERQRHFAIGTVSISRQPSSPGSNKTSPLPAPGYPTAPLRPRGRRVRDAT